jgi:hypothetical protein
LIISRETLLRTIVLAPLAVFLVWQVTTKSFVAYLAETAPETATGIQPDDPVAFLKLAETSLGANPKSLSAETREQIRTWTQNVMLKEPLNARALSILAHLAEDGADDKRTSRLMLAAARRSVHESSAIYWLMRQSYGREDFASTVYYADILLRTRPRYATGVIPVLAQMSEHTKGSIELKRLIESNPPWRSQFFSALSGNIVDARTPLNLLLSLKDTHNPPTVAEINLYLSFLIEKKLYQIAYYAWLQFLSPEQLGGLGLLFNGNFESAPSGLPFDWLITPGSGATVDIVPRPDQDDKRALFIEFGYGRIELGPIRQLVVLAPGAYQLKGEYQGEIIGQRGLQWRVTCAEGASVSIGQSPMAVGIARSWKSFEFEFTVPHKDCRAQYVDLVFDARSASEKLVTGSIWYSGLRIDRADSSHLVQ